MGLKKFDKVEDVPEFPGCKSEEEHNKLVKEYLEAGAIAKEDLIVGAWYAGTCRNTYMAQWTGKYFRFIRDKFSGSYIDTLNHFQDDDGYDVFVPIKLINYD
jgi:hypothetical protein